MYRITPVDPRPTQGDQICHHRVKYISTLSEPLTDHEDDVNDFLAALKDLTEYTVVIKDIQTDVIQVQTLLKYTAVTQIHYCLLYTSPSPRDRS